MKKKNLIWLVSGVPAVVLILTFVIVVISGGSGGQPASGSGVAPTPAVRVIQPSARSTLDNQAVTKESQPARWTERQDTAWVSAPFLSDALSDIAQLFSNPAPSSASRREEVELKAFVITTIQLEAQAIRPPLRFQKVHDTYLEALEAYGNSAELTVSWLRSVEADPAFIFSDRSIKQLELMTGYMKTGGALTGLATSQIQ